MSLKIQFINKPSKKADVSVLFVDTDKKILSEIDNKVLKPMKTILDKQSSFKAKAGETIFHYIPSGKDDFDLLMLCGIGEQDKFDHKKAEIIGGKLASALSKLDVETCEILGADIEHLDHVALGIQLRSYKFDQYKSNSDDKDKKPKNLSSISVTSSNVKSYTKSFARLDAVSSGVVFARDLVNEAPNALYPESYAKRIQKELKDLNVKVTILDDKKCESLGMGGIMAVGKGSERKPRMVIMEYKNSADKKQKPVALVGKGVTFDTGGISIKPASGMDEMKMDMGGSAAVVGAMKALAKRKAKAHVIGIVGLAENMPSHNAYRPGDIITSYAGKTIEVLNTDAEGRLVLIDALTYVQEKYDPHTIIDLATLTGAIMVALGTEYCGTFTNQEDLWDQLAQSSYTAHEKIWRMPLDETWSKEMESDVADLRNLGKSRFAGASTAAAFLGHFIDEGRSWAHMDIAGTAWSKSDKAITPKHGTGFGVRTLEQFIFDHYEDS